MQIVLQMLLHPANIVVSDESVAVISDAARITPASMLHNIFICNDVLLLHMSVSVITFAASAVAS